MEWHHYLLVVAVGFLSGGLNTVAGGGSLISMPILIFMGLPPTVANGTNRVAILAQNIFAVGGFHSKGLRLPMPYTAYLVAVSLAGGLIGATLAVDIPEHLFKRIIAAIMVAVVITVVANRGPKTAREEGEKMSVARQITGIVLFFVLGIYGGFLQAGIGFLVIALLSHVNRFNLVKINYIKVFAALLYTGAAVVIFAVSGKIDWPLGIVLAIGQGIGGWYASRWSVDKGEKWIKRVLGMAVAGMAVKLWFFPMN